jgi:hypothetical protein
VQANAGTYRHLVWQRTLEHVGKVDVVIGALLSGVVALIAVLGWISAGTAAVLLALGAAATLLAFGRYVAVVSFRLWLEARRELAVYTAVPPPTVEVLAPFQGNLWLLRLKVTSSAKTPRRFRATVVDTFGVPARGPEYPWPVPWRHTRQRAAELDPGVPELLLVGGIVARDLVVFVHEYDGEPHRQHPTVVEGDVCELRIEVRDTNHGQLVSEVLLRVIPSEQGMPKLELVDLG